MVDDMSDGMVNILEEKILRNMASQKIEFQGPIQDKIDQLRAGKFTPDLKNWHKIDFNETNFHNCNDNDWNQTRGHHGLNMTK